MDQSKAFRREVKAAGAWRAEVGARIGRLCDRLAAVPVESLDADKRPIVGAVEAELDNAYRAAEKISLIPDWWAGSSVTKAWEAVHSAEQSLLRIESDDAVLATVPRLLAWVQRTMDAGPTRETHEAALKAEMAKKCGDIADCVKVNAALTEVISANSQRYAAVRSFRNNLVMVTGLLIAVLLTVAIWHANSITFLPICVGTAPSQHCIDGTSSSPADVWIVLLMGALGGLLGIAFKLSETTEADRFDPKSWQRFLKPVTGAATALVAILFLQSNIIVGLKAAPSQALFLGYAVLFGFSQQVLTKFVDERAENLVKPKT